jgi:hypothetical protein
MKLDGSDFARHVVVGKSGGFVRRLLFTPADPSAFADTLRQAVARRRG